MIKPARFLDPSLLLKLSRLNLVARLVVEGFISGLHRSPYHGFSVEFSEHKVYTPGDDLKFLDWKVMARTDRYYVKRFQEETNLKAYILLDASGSMAFGSGEINKFQYGLLLTASLSYLLIRQRDAVGLVTFDEKVRRYIPAKSGNRHLRIILEELELLKPGKVTRINRVFHYLAETIKRRGLIIVISDLFDEPEEVIRAIRHFRHRKHEVIVFHLLDPYEIEFPFKGIGEFLDMETKDKLTVNPLTVRDEYWARFDSFIYHYRKAFSESLVDYVRVNISQPLDFFLLSYLRKRARLS